MQSWIKIIVRVTRGSFLNRTVRRNIAFISKNYTSSKCVTNYYKLMMEIRILNNAPKSVVMHTVEESQCQILSTIKPALYQI